LSACRSSKPAPETVNPEPIGSSTARASEVTPSWVGESLSWEKLKEIETWLALQPAASPKSYWQIEGELQLNSGRLAFARRDQGKEKATPEVVQARMRTARAGLERVLAEPEASEGQKRRAQDSLARADKQADSVAGVAASTTPNVALISRASWGAMAAHTQHMDKNEGGWKRITVHHSAEPNPPPLDGSIAESAAAVRSIQKEHIEIRDYGDIGYHFVIDPFGRVFQGREMTWRGAHAHGDNNIQNVGVCLIGNFQEARPTKAALDSLRRLLDQLRKQYAIPRSAIVGHSDLWNTECPGRYLEPWVREYARESSSLTRSAPVAKHAASASAQLK
jgi:N-acetyl-anhydromuramyl-L-alanine amidase AmpD